MNGSEKGSLLSGALRSCISKFDSDIQGSTLEISEFPTFVGSVAKGIAHVFVSTLPTADIGAHLAFALKSQAESLVLYLPHVALPGTTSSAATEVFRVLSLQRQGFGIPVEVFSPADNQLSQVTPGSNLQLVVQEESARSEFLNQDGAEELVELVLGCGCEALFIKERMVATHLGLEVARSKIVDGRLGLEIGVGRNDRMAKSWLSESKSQADQLHETIEVVNRYRLGSSQFHPLAKLSMARWMRLAIQDNPALIGVEGLVPVELVRTGSWPNSGLWSLKASSEPNDEDSSMYQGFDPSFEEDGISFGIGVDADGAESVVGIAASLDLGVVAKLYEVLHAARAAGRQTGGSILVLEERNKIVPIERLVDLASFGIRSATLLPTWKMIIRD